MEGQRPRSGANKSENVRSYYQGQKIAIMNGHWLGHMADYQDKLYTWNNSTKRKSGRQKKNWIDSTQKELG